MKNLLLKTSSLSTLLTVSLIGLSVNAHAAWPEKTVTIVVPAAPGGTTDLASRVLAEKLSQRFDKAVVVENRAGAAGIVGTQYVAKAKPDGYTLIMGNIGPNAINYSMYKDLPYDKDDLDPISLVISNPNVLVVNEKSPANNVEELIDHLNEDKDKNYFGSSGTGQSPHMSGEMFLQRANVEAEHVPYKGAGPAVTALLSNQFTFMIDNLPSSLPHIKSGKLKALAVTSDERSSELPDVPTLKEAGVEDMVVRAWFGLFAPKGTPDDVIQKIYEESKVVLESDEVKKKYKDMGGEAGGNSPDEFKAFVKDEQERWAEIVEAANLSQSN